MKLKDVVAQYVKLRDQKSLLKKQYDEKKAAIDTQMAKIEGVVLKAFQAQGVTTMGTPAGTAYISTRVSTSVADRDEFLNFVRSNEAWEFLENRVSKTAVEEYKEAHGDLPPGVNWSAAMTLNVRRS